MTNSRSLCLLIGMLAGTAGAGTAQEPYLHILNSSGITAVLPSLPAHITNSAIANANRCESTPHAGWTLPADTLIAAIVDRLATASNDAQVQTVSSWYRSALARKISTLEQQAVNDAEFSDFISSRADNRQWQISTLPFISQIYENTHAGELNAITGLEIEYTGLMLSGCIEKSTQQGSSRDHSNVEQTRAAIIRADKQMMMTLFRTETIYAIGYSLRSLSTAELTSYANFTSENRAFYKSLVRSFEAALQQSSNRLLSGRSDTAEQLSGSTQD